MALPFLKELLSHQSKGVRKETLWALSNLIAGTPQQIQAVIDSGVLGEFETLIQGGGESQISKEILTVLSNASNGATIKQVWLAEREQRAESREQRAESREQRERRREEEEEEREGCSFFFQLFFFNMEKSEYTFSHYLSIYLSLTLPFENSWRKYFSKMFLFSIFFLALFSKMMMRSLKPSQWTD